MKKKRSASIGTFNEVWGHPGPCWSCGDGKDVAWSTKGSAMTCPSGHRFPCASQCGHLDCAHARHILDGGDPCAIITVGPGENMARTVDILVAPVKPRTVRVARRVSQDAVVRLLDDPAGNPPKPGSVPGRVHQILVDANGEAVTVADVQAAMSKLSIKGSATSELKYLVKRGLVSLGES